MKCRAELIKACLLENTMSIYVLSEQRNCLWQWSMCVCEYRESSVSGAEIDECRIDNREWWMSFLDSREPVSDTSCDKLGLYLPHPPE